MPRPRLNFRCSVYCACPYGFSFLETVWQIVVLIAPAHMFYFTFSTGVIFYVKISAYHIFYNNIEA